MKDVFASLENYMNGYKGGLNEEECEEYTGYIERMKSKILSDINFAPETLVNAELKAKAQDYRRMMTHKGAKQIYSSAIEHLKLALMDSCPFSEELK